MEEVKERQAELSKMRALMFYQERKQHHMNKIKSKVLTLCSSSPRGFPCKNDARFARRRLMATNSPFFSMLLYLALAFPFLCLFSRFSFTLCCVVLRLAR